MSKKEDVILPADSYTTTSLDKPVKLRINDKNDHIKPISIYNLFHEMYSKNPSHLALAYKPDKTKPWVEFSYEQYWNSCIKVAKSLIKVDILNNFKFLIRVLYNCFIFCQDRT
jgi:long-subunit acyl-CoA synthetase (AMP-forming)